MADDKSELAEAQQRIVTLEAQCLMMRSALNVIIEHCDKQSGRTARFCYGAAYGGLHFADSQKV